MNNNQFMSHLKELNFEKTFQLQQEILPQFLLAEEISIRNLELIPHDRIVEIGFDYMDESFICRFKNISQNLAECWLEIYFASLPTSFPDSFIDFYRQTISHSEAELHIRHKIIVLGYYLSKEFAAQELVSGIKTLCHLKKFYMKAINCPDKDAFKDSDNQQMSLTDGPTTIN